MTAPQIETRTVEANGQQLYVRTCGPEAAPFVLLLHGFPEYGGAWDHILPRLGARALVAAPDQRGYNFSSKPATIEAYKAHHLAADMLALADVLAPGRPIHLVGHDWGASVAYMMAFLAPKRIARLVVVNGVHPIPFQRALIEDAEQREASQYIRFLRRPDSAPLLLADECRRAFAFLTGGFGGGRWLDDARRQGYRAAWQQPGAMEAMVAWYKATPLVVPLPAEAVVDDPMARLDPKMLRVRMPHLVLWGLEDKALRPSCRTGLGDLCDDLTLIDVPAADHWIVHQQPDRVVDEVSRFFGLV